MTNGTDSPLVLTTKTTLFDLKGKALKFGSEQDAQNMTVGDVLGFMLVGGQKGSGDPLRAYLLAKKITESETVELTLSDKQFIENMVKGFEGFTDIVKGQILLLFQ